MASLNKITRPMATKARVVSVNAEGTPVKVLTSMQELRRTVLSYMLWEDDFYEDGKSITGRIADLVGKLCTTEPESVASLAIEAREQFNLRHVPLLIVREMARSTNTKAKLLVGATLATVIQRPDELTEFLAIYWKDKKQPLSAQVKKGLAAASLKFNEYSLAKYNRKGVVNLKDVIKLVHPKPINKQGENLFGRLLKDELDTPDTWEVALSAGKDKKETFTRLMKEGALGAMAVLKNLRNMEQAGVDRDLISHTITTMDVRRVLPFRFISAAKYAPSLEPALEVAMLKALAGMSKLKGCTALVIDKSGSMKQATVSLKSELTRLDAAAALAILAREICEDVRVFAFSDRAAEIPARHGFALRDAILKFPDGGSRGGLAVDLANKAAYDRIIVITDGQWHTSAVGTNLGWDAPMGDAKIVSPAPLTDKAYMLNVGTYKNGVGYGKWFALDGWSESVLQYISGIESMKG